jgi:protein-tyrosine phosphatase
METPLHFVDIHCHLLPQLDDGADSWDEALAMAKVAVADGISTIVATPHQLGGFSENRGAEIRAQSDRLQTMMNERRIPLTVLPGADVRIEPGMIEKIRAGEVLTLADRGRHVLLELPHDVYFPLDRLLADLKRAGLTGILSHPERNRGIIAQPGVVKSLAQAGCLMQITAASLLGGFGSRVQSVAEQFVKQGLVHFVSTDAHRSRSRPPLLSDAYDRVVELTSPAMATECFCHNPAAVAAGRPVAPGPREAATSGRKGWLPWSRVG